MWVVFLDSNGECWTYPNPKIRAQKNITMDRLLEKLENNGLESNP